jgi:nitrous oxidase accessory protein NosD
MRRRLHVFRVLVLTVPLLGLVNACGSRNADDSKASPATEITQAAATSVPSSTDAGTRASTTPATTEKDHVTKTLEVPSAYRSVQEAVDAAQSGDLVLIGAGTYAEAVVVRVPDIVIRGVDRNAVVFDGRDEIENGIIVAADGVAVENLTLRHYAFNGLLFTKAYDDSADAKTHTVLNGYRASYVTAYDNGSYGIYAFFARGGRIERTYTSGHPDSGIYVGQCKPCDAVVTDNISELNAIGYSGTNSSGNLFIVNSVWRRNRIGMTPNSQDQERLAPQGDVVIAGNIVADNQDPGAPATPKGASGFGIAVSGGERNQVVKNRVTGNVNAGIAVTDLNEYRPAGNVVSDNVLERNGTDLIYAYTAGTTRLEAKGNCFSGNTFATSLPDGIETVLPCATPAQGPVASGAMRLQVQPPDVDYRTIAPPAPQPNMPNASAAPVPASRAVPTVDLSAISVPK